MRKYIRKQVLLSDHSCLSYYSNNNDNNRLNWIINNTYSKYIKNRNSPIIETILTGSKSPIIDFMNNLERVEALNHSCLNDWILFHGLNVGAGTWIPKDINYINTIIPQKKTNINSTPGFAIPYMDTFNVIKKFNIVERNVKVTFVTNNDPVNSTKMVDWVLDNIYYDINGNVDEAYLDIETLTKSENNHSNKILDIMNKLSTLHRYHTDLSEWTYFTEVNIN